MYRSSSRARPQVGFTFVELALTLGIAVVLIGVAADRLAGRTATAKYERVVQELLTLEDVATAMWLRGLATPAAGRKLKHNDVAPFLNGAVENNLVSDNKYRVFVQSGSPGPT